MNTQTIIEHVQCMAGTVPSKDDFLPWLEPRPKIYVAGPYTKGDVAINVRNAILAGDRLYYAGYIPFIPHLTHFWHLVSPSVYEVWMDMDSEWLSACDCLVRLEGESDGADKEVKQAMDIRIPVYFSVEEAINALANTTKT